MLLSRSCHTLEYIACNVNCLMRYNVNKSELVASIAARCETSKKMAALFVDAFCESVTESLKSGQSVRIVGFGAWKTNEVAPRVVMNPRDKSPIQVPRSTRVRFTTGDLLKKAVNR